MVLKFRNDVDSYAADSLLIGILEFAWGSMSGVARVGFGPTTFGL